MVRRDFKLLDRREDGQGEGQAVSSHGHLECYMIEARRDGADHLEERSKGALPFLRVALDSAEDVELGEV